MRSKRIALMIFSILISVWAGLLIAPYMEGGLISVMRGIPEIMQYPFRINMCAGSIRTALSAVSAAALIEMSIFSSEKKKRPGAEHGSATWGKASDLKRKYGSASGEGEKILTRNVSISLDGRRHGRNLNVIAVGGSGSGKTRSYAMPNIMNADCSYVVLDPKGETLRMTGSLLEKKGYTVRVIDLVDMERSHCYNPFVYLESDSDVQRLVTNLFQNTRPKNSQTQDPFWDQAAQMLLLALMLYLKYEAPEDERNFSMVMEMIRAGDVQENNDAYLSPLDILFERLEMKDPSHIALKYYRSYRSGSAKTLKSIQITLMSRLEKFNLESLAGITNCDELELDAVGERKTAVFAVIPDDDSSFNFLVGMLYTQLFQQLYRRADRENGGRLPVHVHFIMDEFANVALPDQFEKIMSTMRSREISVSVILQNLSQLRALFDRQWESIIGNSDEFLYLGGNEQSTHEYISKMLGKETIDVSSKGKNKGRSGGSSENWQKSGRELMTPDEVRMLDNKSALLFIRGEKPVTDLKYDIRRHPAYRMTPEGSATAFRYGEDDISIASVAGERGTEETDEFRDRDLIVLTDEELEDLMEKRKEKRA